MHAHHPKLTPFLIILKISIKKSLFKRKIWKSKASTIYQSKMLKLIIAISATQSVLSCPAAKKSNLRSEGKTILEYGKCLLYVIIIQLFCRCSRLSSQT